MITEKELEEKIERLREVVRKAEAGIEVDPYLLRDAKAVLSSPCGNVKAVFENLKK